VSVGFYVRENDGRIEEARVAFGGMAGTPKRASHAEAALVGRPFAEGTFEAAAKSVEEDFSPLTDWRASADYRRRVAANLFRRFWWEQSGAAEPVRIQRAVGA
jgi:xanthine dehydrogenase small subunit